jgi:hypothetical protein
MLTLYSYPELFGVPDNNPFGLKVFAFLKLVGLPFRHEHIFDAKAAPRGQLPYIDDNGTSSGTAMPSSPISSRNTACRSTAASQRRSTPPIS